MVPMIFRRVFLSFLLSISAVGVCAGDDDETFDRLKIHGSPRPLAKNAQVEDWTRFLGPRDDADSIEAPLLKNWGQTEGATPLKLVWEIQRGEGYASPVVEKDRMVLFHAMDGMETLECIHPETGKRYWSYQYPIEYRDRYGFANGPRGTPLIADGCVVSLGVTSVLTCLDLSTGSVIWQKDLRKEYGVPQDFFGHGSSPNYYKGKVIVNVGGKGEGSDNFDDSEARYEMLARKGVCLAAFDIKTGKLSWSHEDEWGASYASPILKKVHGKEVCLAYVGGESKPATGGLVVLDTQTGQLLGRFAWRGDEYIQAIGSSPVWIADLNSVFISTAYPKGRPLGGVMLEITPDFKIKEKWTSKKFATHWMTPVYHEGHLYGIDGETERRSYLVCFNADTGEEVWREDVRWDDLEVAPGRAVPLGIQRASLLKTSTDFLVLGELGTLLRMELSPKGAKILNREQLFYAQGTWGLPLVYRGLLYVMQNEEEQVRGRTGRRLLCYDLRGE